MVPQNDFDPTRAPPDTGHPLREYLQPPAYLGGIAVLQFALAALSASLLLFSSRRAGGPGPVLQAASIGLTATLLGASGVGLVRRKGWGWWLTAALYYCVFFNLPVNLILWTTRRNPFSLPVQLVTFGLAVAVLVCLTRPELLRFIRFNTPDGRPARRTMASPVWAGAGWSVLHLVIALVRG